MSKLYRIRYEPKRTYYHIGIELVEGGRFVVDRKRLIGWKTFEERFETEQEAVEWLEAYTHPRYLVIT